MKLRLTQGGFENYSGQMGIIQFENGLSVGDVNPHDALRIASVVGAEWENGQSANVGQLYLDNMDTPAPVNEKPVFVAPVETKIEAPVAKPVKLYTEDQLAAIADKSGIAGLREIADPLGVKGKSIRDLIDGVLKVAGAPAPKAE